MDVAVFKKSRSYFTKVKSKVILEDERFLRCMDV